MTDEKWEEIRALVDEFGVTADHIIGPLGGIPIYLDPEIGEPHVARNPPAITVNDSDKIDLMRRCAR